MSSLYSWYNFLKGHSWGIILNFDVSPTSLVLRPPAKAIVCFRKEIVVSMALPHLK